MLSLSILVKELCRILKRKLLDEVREIMRLCHYSIHTERAYCDWIKRYVKYHGMTSRNDLEGGEAKIEAFLTHFAVNTHVALSTQNQAVNALGFLYKQVLKQITIGSGKGGKDHMTTFPASMVPLLENHLWRV